LTYEICNEKFPEKTNFVPHALPEGIFFKLPENDISISKTNLLGNNRADHFVVLWINRNARRKRSNDVLEAWKLFLDKLEEKHGHRKATLLMHTEPTDAEGPNLFATTEMFGIKDNVVFSTERIGFDQMNVMHNISDCCVNIAYAEGFGLSTLEAMQTGTPIIAIKTGGLTRQVVDHRDGSENGIALPVEMRALVGSQAVPYIYEDYVSNETVANAFFKMFEMGPDSRKKLGLKGMNYVKEEFGYQKTIDLWHQTMKKTTENFKEDYARWDCTTI
jgi:glycosyltransferase involved in cell wall biosynthesis